MMVFVAGAAIGAGVSCVLSVDWCWETEVPPSDILQWRVLLIGGGFFLAPVSAYLVVQVHAIAGLATGIGYLAIGLVLSRLLNWRRPWIAGFFGSSLLLVVASTLLRSLWVYFTFPF